MPSSKQMTVQNLAYQLDHVVDEIVETFRDFTDGPRVMMLINRAKDGGHNKEEQRLIKTAITYSTEQFRRSLRELIILKHFDERPLRIYLSVNRRNLKKVIRYVRESLLQADYADEEERNNTYQKLLRSPKHFLMQPKCTDESYFILDIDNEEGFDRMGEALRMMEEVGAEEMLRYPTKNGWHFVVKPFNPNLWLGPGEIKKDGLLLLSY